MFELPVATDIYYRHYNTYAKMSPTTCIPYSKAAFPSLNMVLRGYEYIPTHPASEATMYDGLKCNWYMCVK